jgi:hypothetical protein
VTILVHRLPSRCPRLAEPLIAEARERQRRRRLWIAAAIVICAGAGGIGYSVAGTQSSPARAVPFLHPCRLLTSAEVAGALAGPIDRRQPSRGSCTWYGHVLGTFTSAQPQLALSVVGGMTKEEFVKAFRFELMPDGLSGAMQRVATQPLRSVGQTAFSMMSGNELAVWYEQTVVQVDVSFVTSPPAVTRRLAATVIDRLPAQVR